jgi:WD40 repeat protein
MSKSVREFLDSKGLEKGLEWKIIFLKKVIPYSIKSGRVDILRQFLTDFDFMIAKIEAQDFGLGVQSILFDFESTIQAKFDTEDELLLSLKKSIQLSSTAIKEDISQLYPQIYARLLTNENLNLLNLLNSYEPRHPWLRLISDTFQTAQDSLIQIMGEGHAGIIDGCAISDDATIALSASRDTTLRVWDLVTGSCDHILTGHTDRVNSCALSGNGLLALSASNDGTLRVWNAKTGSCVHILNEHTDAVTDCSLSKNGKIAVSSAKDGTAKIWNTATGECTFTFEEHTDYVTCCSLSSDGEKALSGSCDGTLRLWDTQSGGCFSVFENGSSAIIDCALSGSGHIAISVSDSFWLEEESNSEGITFKAAKNNKTDEIEQDDIVNASEFPTNVKEDLFETLKHMLELANVSLGDLHKNKLLNIWDCQTKQCIHSFEDPDGEDVITCDLSENGEMAISGNTGGSLAVWDLRSKECRSVLPSSSVWLSSCGLDRKGTFALAASQNLDFRLWDLQEILKTRTADIPGNRMQSAAACKYASNGNIAISISSADIIYFWNAKTGDCLRQIKMEGSYWTHHSSISIESKLILVTSMKDLTGKIAIVDLLTGKIIRVLTGHTAPVFHGEISEDGSIGLSGTSDRTIRIWDILNGLCLHVIDVDQASLGEVSSCALSPDGKIALVGFTTGILKLWNTQDGSCLKTLHQQKGAISFCSINEESNLLMSSSDDNSLLIWDLDSGEYLHKIVLDRDTRYCAAFSPNGKLLLYTPTRQKVQLISTETAEIVASFSFDSWISNLAFSPTAQEIMVGDYSGCIHFMSLEGLDMIK